MIEKYISCKDNDEFLLLVRAALLIERWGDLIPDCSPLKISDLFQQQVSVIEHSLKEVFNDDFQYVNHIVASYLQGTREQLLDVERQVLLQSVSVLTGRDALVLAIRFGLNLDTGTIQAQKIDEAIELLEFCRQPCVAKAFEENNTQHRSFSQFIEALIKKELAFDTLPDVELFQNTAQNNPVFLELLNRNCILPLMDEKERLDRKKEQLLTLAFSDDAPLTSDTLEILKIL